jgi:hypothetical protein
MWNNRLRQSQTLNTFKLVPNPAPRQLVSVSDPDKAVGTELKIRDVSYRISDPGSNKKSRREKFFLKGPCSLIYQARLPKKAATNIAK